MKNLLGFDWIQDGAMMFLENMLVNELSIRRIVGKDVLTRSAKNEISIKFSIQGKILTMMKESWTWVL